MLLLSDILSMSLCLRLATLSTLTTLYVQSCYSQSYSQCNPTEQSCPADPALGSSISIDFRSGASSSFTPSGYPIYGTDGVSFTISQSGDTPTLISSWYMMFGRYEIKMKVAPGQGIVSSVVLQSDDLDEIDLEFVGSQNNQAQTNYFRKGQRTSSTQAGRSYISDSQTEWHTYAVDWTDNQITWAIDGSVIRILDASNANGQYPQTPMRLKFGAWSGGDPSNAEGTIQWAGGPTNYAAGPFTMVVESVSATDYSTGQSYSYGGESGDWKSITSSGGKINANFDGSASRLASPAQASGSSFANAPVSASSSASFAFHSGSSVIATVSIRFVVAMACSLAVGFSFSSWR